MTSDITENMASPEATADASREAAPTVRPRGFAMWSLGFFAVSLLLSGVAGLQILVPELVAGVGFLTYGKLLPVATNMFVYGWLTIGLAGALLYVAGVESGRDLPRSRATQLMLPLMAVGVIVGSVGIAAGFSEGRLYLEYPLWADVFLLAGFVVLAATLGRMTSHGAVTGPVRWYANCCKTPIGSTALQSNMPFFGMLPRLLLGSDDQARVDALLGPPTTAFFADHAIARNKRDLVNRGRMSALAIAALGRRLVVAKLRGDHKRSPFVDPATGALRAEPVLLTEAARAALYAKV